MKLNRKGSLAVLERDVLAGVRSFLRAHGWRVFRNQVALVRNVAGGSTFSVGEKGMPDLLAIFYRRGKTPAAAHVLWIETKRSGEKAKAHQEAWADAEYQRGAAILTVDDLQEFMDFYEAMFGFLHAPGTGVGQLDLLSGGSRELQVSTKCSTGRNK